LAEVPPNVCREELARSRELIEDALGHAVRCLAYPFGSHNEQVRTIARECGYEAACSVAMGLSTAADDPLALARVPVLGTDSMFDFVSRLGSAFSVGDRLRDFAQSVTGRLPRATHPE
jgi:peptidoglycan/xylan/chitin deacetylase (PgdA/CDA1 family)